jgi:hypothetical protein
MAAAGALGPTRGIVDVAMSIKWNPEVLHRSVESVFNARADEMQAVLDSLRTSEQGKDVAAVKATLASRWQQEFGSMLSDEFLQSVAERLAGGTRVVLRPGNVPPIDL